MSLAAGDHLGHFEILGVIEAGGMSEMWRTIARELGNAWSVMPIEMR